MTLVRSAWGHPLIDHFWYGSFIGFMYSADADGRGQFFFVFKIFFLGGLFAFFFGGAYIDLRGQLERDPESDRFGHPPPPRIMIIWRSIESTTKIAQLRWRNALAWSPLAQCRHGRRRHNYGGATSFSQRWANIFLPTICQRCRPCWKK